MKKGILLGGLGFVVILFLAGCASSKQSQEEVVGQQAKTFSKEIKKKVEMNYLLYLPKNYNSAQEKFPLMVFLHGAGERGNDLNLVKKHGTPKLIDQGKEFPFIVASPQCPENVWWSTEDLSALIDELVQLYQVDEKRIYVTGLSMGGYGTWALAEKFPNRFAAIAPVCGGGNPLTICKIGKLPVWAFHGAKDFVVPVNESQQLVTALKNCGNDVKFTIYPETGHDAWVETYNNPELYDWLLKQKK
ncbi:MAG: prolyl oligopeptidase family serine peptidase [Ignavibacteriaceae bacterium]|nr:prolyl oligopeptidase family serine peptidase [Ignavibacteriaceae bacterium]